MFKLARRILLPLLLGAAGLSPATAQVGIQRMSWTVTAPALAGASKTDAPVNSVSVPGMVWYPTSATASAQQWGPFRVTAAPGASPTPGQHPLVVISHGTGGHELGHAWIAERLAAVGYVVLSLRHPGDNYEDRSAVARADFFAERPRQVTRVLDQFLADARWSALVDAQRIAAIGHSAGGYTVLALAGARPDRRRVVTHCGAQGIGLREDAPMCELGGFSPMRPAPAPDTSEVALPDLRDARIRAVVAEAPLGLVPTNDSLAAITTPIWIEYGAADEVLTPRFHAEALCKAIPNAHCERNEPAGHFAFFQAGTGRLGGPGVEPSSNPAGFDRLAWQAQAWPRLRDFLASALK